MNWAYRLALYLHEKNLLRFLPWRFLRTYIYPLTVRGAATPYHPARFFDSYYRAAGTEFSDRVTIGPAVSELHSRFHYNCVESSIIRALLRCRVRQNPAVFDLGSGAGHWIDFYRGALGASRICGLDISQVCVASLRSRYFNVPGISVLQGDIAQDGFRLDQRFDIVNAIGVVFHIVDDELWLRALANLRALLENDGVMIVGGHFGWITRNVQFHASDEFEDVQGMRKPFAPGEARVNKRIRSLRRWKKAARSAGLRVKFVVRTANVAEIVTPENNILVLERWS
jgi:trans-aconitate methyltransferase